MEYTVKSESHSVVSNSLLAHGLFQARILEWVAIPFSRGSSQPRDWTQVSCIAGRFFTCWATREAQAIKQQLKILLVSYYWFDFKGWLIDLNNVTYSWVCSITISCQKQKQPTDCRAKVFFPLTGSNYLSAAFLRPYLCQMHKYCAPFLKKAFSDAVFFKFFSYLIIPDSFQNLVKTGSVIFQ